MAISRAPRQKESVQETRKGGEAKVEDFLATPHTETLMHGRFSNDSSSPDNKKPQITRPADGRM